MDNYPNLKSAALGMACHHGTDAMSVARKWDEWVAYRDFTPNGDRDAKLADSGLAKLSPEDRKLFIENPDSFWPGPNDIIGAEACAMAAVMDDLFMALCDE